MTGPSITGRSRHSLVLVAVFVLALAVPTVNANAQINPYGVGRSGNIFPSYRSPPYVPCHSQLLDQCHEAAEGGNISAQVWLSFAYVMGKGGLEQDMTAGLKWLLIAEAGRMRRDFEWFEMVVRRATPVGVAEAQRLAREWLEKHSK